VWRRLAGAQTQFEAWLSFQSATKDGLRPAQAQYRRDTIVPIMNANLALVQSLVDMWAAKTPQEAHRMLSMRDVTVTNQSDKTTQLAKLLTFDEKVKAVFAHGAQ